MNVNLEQSTKWAKIVDAKDRRCFQNSQLVVLSMNENENALYCEGYALNLDLGVPIEHAWVTRNGYIIDVTWRDSNVKFMATRCYTYKEVQDRLNKVSPFCVFVDKLGHEHQKSLFSLLEERHG